MPPDAVTDGEAFAAPAARLGKLHEQYRQLLLIDSHEEAGNLTPKTAAIYRVHVLRGGSIIGFPLDGPNAPEFVERLNETSRAIQRDGLRLNLQRTSRAPELSIRNRSSRRAPRRRSVRRARAQARAPGSKDPPDPPLEAVPLSRFRRDVPRSLEGAV